MKRRIEFYGRLREAGDGIELDVQTGTSASALLEAVGAATGKRELLKGAVLATESEVLASAAQVPQSGRLAVLPPVCGG